MQSGTPLTGAGTRDDIRDTLATEQLPVAEFPWVEVSIGFTIAVLIALVVLYVRRRRRPKMVESAETVARRRLAAMAAQAAPERRAFHAELSDTLLRYMETRLDLPAKRLTSRELVRAFYRNGHMDEAWRELLEQLLAECDRAKFAPASDAAWDPAATLQRGKVILDALAVQVASAPRWNSPWKGWSDAAV